MTMPANVVPITDAPRPAGTMPVHDLDAELAVNSAMLCDPATLETVRRLLRPEHMYAAANRWVMEAIYAVADAGDCIDVITVGRWLKARERLTEVGGAAYIAKTVEMVPAVANVETYARIVFELWQIRELGNRAATIAAHCRTGAYHGEPREVLDRAKRAIAEIADMTPRAGGPSTLNTVLQQRAAEALRATKEGRKELGISTGFPDIDVATSALLPGALWIVAARPGCGKTSLATCIAVNVADLGHTVLLVSGEQTKEQLATRMAASEARVDVSRINQWTFGIEEQERIVQAQGFLGGLPLYVDAAETPEHPAPMFIQDVRHWARKIAADAASAGKPLRLLVVDYLQRFARSDEPQDIAEVSRGLKALAKELAITVIAPTQMSRAIEGRGGLPRMSDLKGSSQIESDADIVAFLIGEEKDDVKRLYVAKARDAKKGTVIPLTFRDAFTRFDSYLPEHGPIPTDTEEPQDRKRSSRPGRYDKRRDP